MAVQYRSTLPTSVQATVEIAHPTCSGFLNNILIVYAVWGARLFTGNYAFCRTWQVRYIPTFYSNSVGMNISTMCLNPMSVGHCSRALLDKEELACRNCCFLTSLSTTVSILYLFMHQSFVTTDPPPIGNSGDNDFSSITALLKALYCGDLLRVIALLFIRVNSTGYIYIISQARHLPGTAGELKRSLPCTLAPLSPSP